MKVNLPIIVTLPLWLIVACTGIGTITTHEALPSKTSIQIIETASTSTFYRKTPIDSTATSTLVPSPSLTVAKTQTIVKIPVSKEVNSFMVELLDIQGQDWKVKIDALDLFYEKKEDGSLTLNAFIQCSSDKFQCKKNMPRWAFYSVFVNPEPQPEDLAFFPADLTEFKVYCYDENSNLIDSFAGKWSDLLLLEQGLIPEDELERRLFQP